MLHRRLLVALFRRELLKIRNRISPTDQPKSVIHILWWSLVHARFAV